MEVSEGMTGRWPMVRRRRVARQLKVLGDTVMVVLASNCPRIARITRMMLWFVGKSVFQLVSMFLLSEEVDGEGGNPVGEHVFGAEGVGDACVFVFLG